MVGEAAPMIVKNAVLAHDASIWGKIERGDVLLPKEQDELNVVLRDLKNFFSDQ